MLQVTICVISKQLISNKVLTKKVLTKKIFTIFAYNMCVLRQNEVRYWLYLIDFCRTSKEMVADPLHSACRC